tara:strand:- start:189 stop:584 length:396 start_codon:yes stop_codon:yes gene_type:complete
MRSRARTALASGDDGDARAFDPSRRRRRRRVGSLGDGDARAFLRSFASSAAASSSSSGDDDDETVDIGETDLGRAFAFARVARRVTRRVTLRASASSSSSSRRARERRARIGATYRDVPCPMSLRARARRA